MRKEFVIIPRSSVVFMPDDYTDIELWLLDWLSMDEDALNKLVYGDVGTHEIRLHNRDLTPVEDIELYGDDILKIASTMDLARDIAVWNGLLCPNLMPMQLVAVATKSSLRWLI